MSVAIVKPGLQTTIQSRPRVGLRHLGVPASGAADPLSMALANRLVGNAWWAPVLEASLLGPTMRFEVGCAFALAGARVDATLNGSPVAFHETLVAKGGDELATGATEHGARFYIAVAGGFAAAEVLGSQSTCLLAEFGGHGGKALVAGDAIGLNPVVAKALETPERFRLPMSSSWALRTCESFETRKLPKAARDRLFDTNWTVTRRADRMGLQLEGPRLDIVSGGRMASAAVFPGCVQCPENGLPFALSVDAGTVGGYPRVAQVVRADRHLLGQLRPGDHVRFLHREQRQSREELRAKIEYWREWLPDIEEVI